MGDKEDKGAMGDKEAIFLPHLPHLPHLAFCLLPFAFCLTTPKT